jgi:hypothetical protein
MKYRAAPVLIAYDFPLPTEVALARALGTSETSCGLWPGADRMTG